MRIESQKQLSRIGLLLAGADIQGMKECVKSLRELKESATEQEEIEHLEGGTLALSRILVRLGESENSEEDENDAETQTDESDFIGDDELNNSVDGTTSDGRNGEGTDATSNGREGASTVGNTGANRPNQTNSGTNTTGNGNGNTADAGGAGERQEGERASVAGGNEALDERALADEQRVGSKSVGGAGREVEESFIEDSQLLDFVESNNKPEVKPSPKGKRQRVLVASEAIEPLEESEMKILYESGLSQSEISQRINEQLNKRFVGMNTYPTDIYEDTVIYNGYPKERDYGYSGGSAGSSWRLFQIGYTMNSDGEVTLSPDEPVMVRARTIYEPVKAKTKELKESLQEAMVREVTGEVIELSEASCVRKDGTIKIKLIGEGSGSSGYYSKKLLQEQGTKAFPANTHMYWNHPTKKDAKERPERDLNDLAAVTTTDAKYLEDGPEGSGLYAEAKVFKKYRDTVDEMGPFIGTSIRCLGIAQEGKVDGKNVNVVTNLVKGKSIDFVTVPGAKGKVCQLFESAGGSATELSELEEAELLIVQENEENKMEKSAEFIALEESHRAVVGQLAFNTAREITSRRLQASKLPAPVCKRIAKTVLGTDENPAVIPLKESAIDRTAFLKVLDEAITEEQEYLKSVSPSPRRPSIQGMGSTTLLESGSDDEKPVEVDDKELAEAMSGLFTNPNERLIQEAVKGRSSEDLDFLDD